MRTRREQGVFVFDKRSFDAAFNYTLATPTGITCNTHGQPCSDFRQRYSPRRLVSLRTDMLPCILSQIMDL